jgi:hypothetical protein
MTPLVPLALDEFGASALEGHAERFSVSPGELAGRAARYYLADLGSGRLALRVPRFEEAREKPSMQLTVELDDDGGRELEAEATRQGVSVEALLEHAILYFLADVDSGRAEWRILEDETA